MEKSIENIWKEGFLQSDALIVPKVNDLYNQKSQHTVDKLLRMGKNNVIAILAGASIILIVSILADTPYTGIFIFLQFVWLIWYSRRQALKIEQIDKGKTSYEYIKAVNQCLHKMISGYAKVYRFFYPTFILAFALGMWESNIGQILFEKVLEEFPNMKLWRGVPVYWMAAVLLLAALMGIFAGRISRWDIRVIYGPVLKKLEELETEMEELRA